MLIMTEGGYDFTGADCINWLRDAGFRDVRSEPLHPRLRTYRCEAVKRPDGPKSENRRLVPTQI